MKTTYIITEAQSTGSMRDGYAIEASSLATAKRVASRKKMFKQTVLTISTAHGAVVATKENGVWH